MSLKRWFVVLLVVLLVCRLVNGSSLFVFRSQVQTAAEDYTAPTGWNKLWHSSFSNIFANKISVIGDVLVSDDKSVCGRKTRRPPLLT